MDAESAEGRRTSGTPCALALCALCVLALAAGCQSTRPSGTEGYDADTTPDHDGQAWISEVREPMADVRRAMAEHRAEHPRCAWCGTADEVEVHHMLPAHIAPQAAALPTNLVSLCRRHHYAIGHCGVAWTAYEANLHALLKAHRTEITR